MSWTLREYRRAPACQTARGLADPAGVEAVLKRERGKPRGGYRQIEALSTTRGVPSDWLQTRVSSPVMELSAVNR